jgi:phosphoribosylformimino-5-aminoimidazole carboxamide ribotide isomerase
MRIIPAIDVIDGKCVRLTKGDYSTKKIYNEDPLEVAKAFQDAGIRHLHLVDLDGARSGQIVNQAVLERLATHTDLLIDFGGGVKRDDDIRIAFESGAQQVTCGSIAVKDPEQMLGWLERYGTERIILGADARDGFIAVSGWEQTSEREIFKFVQDYMARGVRYVVCTDISKDGMLQGPSFDLYDRLIQGLPQIKLVASGGVSKLEDLPRLADMGCDGVIIGKAIYENRISLADLTKWMMQ